MSGHSKWATIKRAKGASDAKRGVLFTKLSKNVSLAAKQGKDPDMNSVLRTAIDAAKSANMPKDNIERAILRGAGELPGQVIEEITYEGYGQQGVAIIMRCATDNTNRTGQHIKTTLNKNGGKLGGPGTVSYLFKKRGLIRTKDASEEVQLLAMDAGAEDIIEEEGALTIYCEPGNLSELVTALGDHVEMSEETLRASTTVELSDEKIKQQFNQLIELLEENDDIIDLHHNAIL